MSNKLYNIAHPVGLGPIPFATIGRVNIGRLGDNPDSHREGHNEAMMGSYRAITGKYKTLIINKKQESNTPF
jgi:hypothetical protein